MASADVQHNIATLSHGEAVMCRWLMNSMRLPREQVTDIISDSLCVGF